MSPVAMTLRNRFFLAALQTARRLASGRGTFGRIVGAAAAHLKNPARPLRALRGDLGALLRLARETAAGRYRRLPRRSLVAIVAGLIYFLDPFDLIPDTIPVIGFVDDAAVLGWVLTRVRADLQTFLAWEATAGPVIDVESVRVEPAGNAMTRPK